MTSLDTLYQAVLDTVKTALKAAVLEIEIIRSDLRDPMTRPALKIDFSEETDGRESTHRCSRTQTVRIYFFPSNEQRFRDEHFAVRDALRSAFCDCIDVGPFEIFLEEGISFDRVDDVLIGTAVLSWYDAIEHEEPDEMMENLTVTY